MGCSKGVLGLWSFSWMRCTLPRLFCCHVSYTETTFYMKKYQCHNALANIAKQCLWNSEWIHVLSLQSQHIDQDRWFSRSLTEGTELYSLSYLSFLGLLRPLHLPTVVPHLLPEVSCPWCSWLWKNRVLGNPDWRHAAASKGPTTSSCLSTSAGPWRLSRTSWAEKHNIIKSIDLCLSMYLSVSCT